MQQKNDKAVEDHLHRIQGQLEGVSRMMKSSKSCEEVVMQLMAARASLEKLTIRLLEDETASCLRSKNKKDLNRLRSLASTLFKYT